MRVLITGGAGFIGSRTAHQLTAAGHDVVVLDNLSEQIHGVDVEKSPTLADVRKVARVVHGDVRDAALVGTLVAETDAVLHLAAETGTGQSMYDIVRYSDVNVVGTGVLLEAVLAHRDRIGRLVVASSRSVYGEGSYHCADHGTVYPTDRNTARLAAGAFDPLCPECGSELALATTREDSALQPASIYAATKLAQENMVLAVGRARSIPAMALRYQNVYGDGQSLSNPYTGILSIFSREMLSGRPVEIFEDGLESRDFVHVEDVAAANVAALTADVEGAHVLNIGTGIGTSVNDIVTQLSALLDYRGEARVTGRFRAGDIRHNIADISRAAAVLGWRSSIPFATGLATFAGWVSDVLPRVEDGVGYSASLNELEARGLIGGGAAAAVVAGR